MPAGSFVGGRLEVEEVLAKEAEEEPHGGDEEEEEEGQEDFPDDLSDLETDHHAAMVEAAEPVGAEGRQDDSEDGKRGRDNGDGVVH